MPQRSEGLADQMGPLSHGLCVPPRTILTATPDVGQHIRPASRKPQRAKQSAVTGQAGVFETAVTAQQRHAWTCRTAVPHNEVRDHRAVGGCDEVLRDLDIRGIEERRCAFDLSHLTAGAAPQQPGRERETAGVEEYL